ncbi:sugar transferase, PEP-CTERM system associated/exopolysaccharide biosynthesis polyprenyl glycosylphosphotransferase [Parasphingorhabdus marina DSM 22363]|uniref:Sugar transferase, PEP-CTERM system associated/exopolysaccharide biosynthesis polyprenyl glycosylphosphotransferase n=1 Tax=Parasphingorhabdus marina DSM 22363 TaxID=1123272 RepID=A0A1N6EW54_9SPHN|nr:TIGR03013 family XrtA/PEP-CTERM system glycosyltransferase [Parasphingorhabdus marina]SIN87230.1 sugar transferase, PEP-CTERM system associated/exopolysaccharide biosynthesis polyprenyl glycosylphosphotransferase [Parasphingorhabdus marina DSM 22363]
MIRLFKHYIPYPVLLLGLLDFLLLVAAAELSWILRATQIGMDVGSIYSRPAPILSFAIALEVALIAVGVYSTEALQSLRFAAARILVAISLGVIFLSILAFALPGITLWRSNSLYAMAMSIFLLMVLRILLGTMLDSTVFKRRLLILGAGGRASRIAKLAQKKESGFIIAGYVDMNEGPATVDGAVKRSQIRNLPQHVIDLEVSEVVLALEERRNSLPVADLLTIKTTGVHVNDMSSFLERETGRVDLDSVNPSWFIFSDGFSSGRRISTVFKRSFDIFLSLALLLLTGPIILLFALLIKLESRGGAFFRQERVGLYGQKFYIPKLRSMRADAEVEGKAVWASENDPRITRIGSFIRKVRIDELPQAWSVLKGEMSFVGPRPERPQFVDDLQTRMPFYTERHMVKPGITGWAQINYPYGASIEDSRHKLEYDLYYAKNYTPFLDILILLQTIRVVLWPEGAR